MKATTLALLLCFVPVAIAQEYPQFADMMKMTNASMDAIRKMEKKSGPQAMRVSERLGTVYELMIPFWRARNAADAVKIAEEGKTAAAEMASAAYSDNAERFDAAFKTLSGTCKACHDVHRERLPEGKSRIK